MASDMPHEVVAHDITRWTCIGLSLLLQNEHTRAIMIDGNVNNEDLNIGCQYFDNRKGVWVDGKCKNVVKK